jgi:hypothetical protein
MTQTEQKRTAAQCAGAEVAGIALARGVGGPRGGTSASFVGAVPCAGRVRVAGEVALPGPRESKTSSQIVPAAAPEHA